MTADLFDTGLSVTRAISLTQPWATLMAVGAKRNETRSARGMPNFTGWVAIHAALGYPPHCKALCWREPFVDALRGLLPLPVGHVLAVARFVDVKRTQDVRDLIADDERAYGDYSDGRRAFITAEVRRLKEPFQARGMLGLWTLPRAITAADLE